MVARVKADSPGYISYEEAMEVLDEQARENLNMSAIEFIDAWRSGTIENPDRPAVIDLAMLIPGAR